jgi:disulfide bond formation protein DsbB
MLSHLLPTLNYRRILLLQALAAAFILGSALVSQYGFGLYPCELCMYQRYPYAAIIVFALLAAWRVKTPRMQLYCIVLGVLLFTLDAGIAFYHTGVELDIFKGPDACSNSGGGAGQSIEELRAAIMNAPLVSCKQAMAYFLGMSMAAWNGLAASFCILLSLVGAIYAKRRF